jgi:hypothetical protein
MVLSLQYTVVYWVTVAHNQHSTNQNVLVQCLVKGSFLSDYSTSNSFTELVYRDI